MKKELKHFIMGASTMAVLMGGLTFAASRIEMVERIFRDIKIKLNGTEITPKDANGKVVEPFIIDGTTYLPVRAVGEAMGLNVDWNDKTSTVELDDNDTCESFSIVPSNMYEFGQIIEFYKFSVDGPYGLPPTIETWLFNNYIETTIRTEAKEAHDYKLDFNWNIDEKFMVGENEDFISVLFKDDRISSQYFFNVNRKTGKFMSTREVLNMINVSDEEITRQYNTILKKFLDDHNIYVLLNDDNLYNKYKIDSFVKSNKCLFVDANGDYYGNVTVPTGNHLYDDVYNMKNGEFLWAIPGL